MAKTIVGIESGTSYAIVAGTKTFTISGLAGKLTKASIRGVLLIRSGIKTALIIANVDDNTGYTLTENAGVYTVDYTGLTTQPPLQVGDELVIDYVADSRQTEISGKLDTVQTSIDALGGLTTDLTHNLNMTSSSGAFKAKASGSIKSYSNSITLITVNEFPASVGTTVQEGDIIKITSSVIEQVQVVIKLANASLAVQNASPADEATINNICVGMLNASDYFGYLIIPGAGDNYANRGGLDINLKAIDSGIGLGYVTTVNVVPHIVVEDSTYIYLPLTSTQISGLLRITKATGAYTRLVISQAVTELIDYGDYILCVSHNFPIRKVSKLTFSLIASSTGSIAVVPKSILIGDKLFMMSNGGNIIVCDLVTMVATSITTSNILSYLYTGGYLYVIGGSTLYKIDPATSSIVGNLTVTGNTTGNTMLSYGTTLYIPFSGGISKINLATFSFVSTLLNTLNIIKGVTDPSNSNIAYLVDSAHNIVSFDLATELVIKTTVTGFSVNGSIIMAINNGLRTLAIGKSSVYGLKIFKLSNLV